MCIRDRSARYAATAARGNPNGGSSFVYGAPSSGLPKDYVAPFGHHGQPKTLSNARASLSASVSPSYSGPSTPTSSGVTSNGPIKQYDAIPLNGPWAQHGSHNLY